MKIDIEKLDDLVNKAGDIWLTPDGEKVLVQILEIQAQVDEALQKAKDIVEMKMLELDPDSTGIKGDHIKAYYRAYGAKYAIDEAHIKELPKDIYEKVIKYKPVTKLVEEFIANHPKGMPRGIIERERKKSISFKLKEKAIHEE